MKRIVILGGGFGGLAAANEMEHLASSKKAEVTLIDSNARFSMGFAMQWAMIGRRGAGEGERPYSGLKAKNVRFVNDEIISISLRKNKVLTKRHSIGYDYLIIALGAEPAPETVPGLAEGSYNLCSMHSVMVMKSALESISKGTVAIMVSSVPFKCPPAPYEYALLIDDMLRKRKVRDRVKIVVTTPEPQPMPVAGKAVGEQVKAMLAQRGIEFFPEHRPREVDQAKKEVEYDNGEKIKYDILGAMAPHRAPKVVREAGLTDNSGFVPVELGTFKTAVENVYAVGDVASIKLPNGKPHPKAGVFAEAQAVVAAGNIMAGIEGKEPPLYEGKGACYIDIGMETAIPADIYLLTPEGPKVFLGQPSKEGVEQKLKFERERLKKWFGK